MTELSQADTDAMPDALIPYRDTWTPPTRRTTITQHGAAFLVCPRCCHTYLRGHFREHRRWWRHRAGASW